MNYSWQAPSPHVRFPHPLYVVAELVFCFVTLLQSRNKPEQIFVAGFCAPVLMFSGCSAPSPALAMIPPNPDPKGALWTKSLGAVNKGP